MVDKNAYTNVFNEAVQELSSLMDRRDELDNEREEIDTRIGQVREGVIALAPLCNVNPYVAYPELFPDLQADIGLTDAIRSVLQLSSQSFLTPVGVRTGLKEAGFDISKKSILPSIHTVLKRLAKNGEVETEDRDGKTVYKWKVQGTKVFGSPGGSGTSVAKPGMGHDPKPVDGPGAPLLTMRRGRSIFSKLGEEAVKKSKE
ncbi:MAG TPA: hypothetical protein VF658_18340 [Pyrinomonadaceae bacterium]|jgi:hypothetical protein